MSGGQLSSELIVELKRGNSEVLAKGRDWKARATEEDLVRPPPAGGWNAGQVFEHLVVSGQLYVDRIDAAMAKGFARGATGDAEWKPTLMGRSLLRAVAPTAVKRQKTFQVFEPGPRHREGVIDAFIALHERVGAQMDESQGLNLRKVKLASPVSGLIRLNLGEVFAILILHAQRHLYRMYDLR